MKPHHLMGVMAAALLFCFIIPVVSAEEDFIVTVGVNKTFSQFNIHETNYYCYTTPSCFLPLASLSAESAASQASVSAYATPGHSGAATAYIGLEYTLEYGDSSWEEIKNTPVTVVLDYSYELEAHRGTYANGNAVAMIQQLPYNGLFMIVDQINDHSGSTSRHVITRLDRTMGDVDTIILVVNAGAFSPAEEDADTTYSSASVTLNSIRLEFPSPPEITGIAPASADQGKYIEYLEIRGSGFDHNAQLAFKKTDGSDMLYPIDVKVVSEHLITCSLIVEENTPIGSWDVMVTNPDNQKAVWTHGFSVSAARPGTLSGRAFEQRSRSGGHYDLVAANGRTIELIQLEVNYVPIPPQVTDSTGYFHFTGLAPGTYRVSQSWTDTSGDPQYEGQEVRVNSDKDTYVMFPHDYALQMSASIKNDAQQDYDQAKADWQIVHNQMVFADNLWTVMFLPLAVKKAATGISAEVLRGSTRWAVGKGAIAVATTAIDPLSPTYYIIQGFDIAHELQLVGLKKIIADPPDYNYTEIYPLPDSVRVTITSEYTTNESEFAFSDSYARLYNSLHEVSAIQDAGLVSYERYQGAFDRGDQYWMYHQLNAVRNYADLEVAKRLEIRSNINDYQQKLVAFNQTYGDIIVTAQANLSADGFTGMETASLQELGFSPGDIEHYRQFLSAYNFSRVYNFYSSTGEVSDNRILYARNLSHHASQVLDEFGLIAHFAAAPTTGRSPLAVQFNDTSIGSPTSWSWSFGDGQSFTTTNSALRNATHTYLGAGNYTVNLTVTNDLESDTEVKTNVIFVSGPHPLPGCINPPTDPDHDGIYEDLNGNTRLDFADVVLYFNQMEWIATNEPVSAFDLNGNGRIDFADIVRLFGEI